jgi:hypothetical protein
MPRSAFLLLTVALFYLGSGGLATAPAHAQELTSPAFELTGLWHGQFPANEGDEGVDIDFCQNQAHFMLDGKRVQRQDLKVERNGDSVSIWLTSLSHPEDQALFTGTFVDPDTLQGRYINTLRGEEFSMDLVKQLPSK